MFYFLIGIMSFLSVVGFVELIRKIEFWLYKPKNTKIYMGVIIKNAEDAENAIMSIAQRLKWMDLGTEIKLIIIDKTKEMQVSQIIHKVIEKFPNISLISDA